MRRWHEVLCWLNVPVDDQRDVWIRHLTLDSRQADVGTLFLALPGLTRHGADFAAQVLAGGGLVLSARQDGVGVWVPDLVDRLAALASWFYDDPASRLSLVGITGTNGKTSTSHYVAQWLHALGRRVAVMGTVGNGVWGEAMRSASHTTPDVVSLYRQLALWCDDGVEVVVMEVSSHAIHQQRIAGLRFAVVALTQVTRDHLDYHGTVEAYHAVKARLFTDWPSRVQVLNAGDGVSVGLLDRVASPLVYGCARGAVQWLSVAAKADGLALTLRIGERDWQGQVGLYGLFNVENLLCAISCVLALGEDLERLMPLVWQTRPVAGRMQMVCHSPVAVVDYAHTPDALEKALQALRAHVAGAGRVWLVFGAGGDRDAGKRPLMGAVACQLADEVIVTDDNPRSESPQVIAQAIASGMACGGSYVPDRAQAIAQAMRLAGKEDVVLVAGKGHEAYQEVAGVRLPFSDVQTIASLCVNKGSME